MKKKKRWKKYVKGDYKHTKKLDIRCNIYKMLLVEALQFVTGRIQRGITMFQTDGIVE